MGDSAPASAQEESSDSTTADGRRVVNVAVHGDVVLDVVYETSLATQRKHRQAQAVMAPKPKPHSSWSLPASAKPRMQVAYRVDVEVLKRSSKYFANLLSNPQFREAGIVGSAHARLLSVKCEPSEAVVDDLPWIVVVDDDEATKAGGGRELAFQDMLRILHRQPIRATRATMSYATSMAIIADRLDCAAAIARGFKTQVKLKWPVTSTKPLVDDAGRATEVEQVLRQKILVSWLLGQPMRLQQSSRELIMRGSSLWSVYNERDSALTAAWWHLPDGIEEELQNRRECILSTIASVQQHFLSLYSSRERQCKLGYDSSAACDSFQLGQMIKFLVSKNLLFLVDYSAASIKEVPDGSSSMSIEGLLATLRQCPNYQIDKHHSNCGLRVRLGPILDYIESMLSASVVVLSHGEWKNRREAASWAGGCNGDEDKGGHDDDERRTFIFTRAVANDQRLRYEGALHVDKMARQLFTSDFWNWTPEP